MPRRIPVYVTLLVAAVLVGRSFVDTQWITETLQAVEVGHVVSTAGASELPAARELRTVTRVIDGEALEAEPRLTGVLMLAGGTDQANGSSRGALALLRQPRFAQAVNLVLDDVGVEAQVRDRSLDLL